MNTKRNRFAIALSLLFGAASTYGQITVYDSLNAGSTGSGTADFAVNNPIFGDTMTLTSGGTLGMFGVSLFNSASGGNTGSILAGNMTINFYDNTFPYTGGTITGALLGTANVSWDFTSNPLTAGTSSTKVVDLSSLNIVLPQNVLVTQQFNQTSGTSTRWGVSLRQNPIVGSSPNTVYISSSALSAGLYTITGGNPGQVAYQIDITGSGGNHPPVANPQSVSVNENGSLPITLTATDADNDPLTYAIATQPSHGTLSGSPPGVTYQPNVNYSGPDSFTFTANDGHVDSAPATISITVNPPLAGLIINPVWDSTILNDPNAAAIENTINTAIQVYETKFSDPVTVTITFAEMTNGLGLSSTFGGPISYSSYYNALLADSQTTNDVIALAHLPSGSINPVDQSTQIRVTTANKRALGMNAFPPGGQSDSTISLNMSIINIDRISINPSKYDLMAVVSHEIDEALGTSSGLTQANSEPPDLFRYTSGGLRTYTTSGDDAWFSIDGGVTDLVRYNQTPGGYDYGDWWSVGVSHTPRVQDAVGTPGATPNLGVELTVLDVVGWDLVVPAPLPTIQTVTRSGNTINFSWASAFGRSYQVQYKTNLTQVGWLNLHNPIVASASTTSSSDSTGPDVRRFYRVALLPTSAAAAPALAHANLESTGPDTLQTRYFPPQQATQMKGQPAKSLPALEVEPALPYQGNAQVQVRGQK